MGDLSRVSAEAKADVLEWVARTRRRAGWSVGRVCEALGVPRSVYYAWAKRESLNDVPGRPCRAYEILAAERQAICRFALQHPKVGYRKLAWMMLDGGVAAVSESTVYRVLSEADLLARWKRSSPSPGEYSFRPTGPNQQWHTDVMYVWVMGCYYFLLSFVDAYSRYVVHHKLMLALNGASVATELEAALERAGPAQPRVVHDHGSEFVNRDVAAVIKRHNLLQIKTRPRHPESNGIVERFNGTVRQESDNVFGANYLEAEKTIAELIEQYNQTRLHAALGYMTPATWHRGQPEQVRIDRAAKLAAARAHRKSINQQRFQEAG